jgi:hypothetical protein
MVDALKAAEGRELIRLNSAMMPRALLDAEATSVIGAGPHERAG